MKGSAIIYVRNRRKTQEIASFLVKNNISADFYHAGLPTKDRDIKQSNWIKGNKRVMVATNAFGMGIDKPDVRVVVHLDIPDNIEAYFQEAGRGGRDEKEAWAILLYEKADILDLERNFVNSFPEMEVIKSVYQALGNFFQIPIGAGKDSCYDFDLAEFCRNYNFNPVVALNSLKFIERQGAIIITDEINRPSSMLITCSHEEFYAFQVANKYYDKFIKLLLRSYGGLFNDFMRISEFDLARNLGITEDVVVKILQSLEKMNLIAYSPQTNKPKLIFVDERIGGKDLTIDHENYQKLKDVARKRLDSMIDYIKSVTKCRNKILLSYFGEKEVKRCGKCDVCIQRNKLDLNEFEFDEIIDALKPLLRKKNLSFEKVIESFDHLNERKVIKVINWLIDNNKAAYNDEKMLYWIKDRG